MKKQTVTALTECSSDDQILIFKIENKKSAIGNPMKINLYFLETMEITLPLNLYWQCRVHSLSIRMQSLPFVMQIAK